jgi:transposase
VSETLHPSSKSAPISAPFFSADLLEQLKAQLEPLLFAAVSVKFNSYEYELQHAQMKVQVLEERLRQQRIAKYGPGSETLSNLQLELLDLEPGVSNAEVAAESEREALLSSPDEKKERRKHPGRQTLPAHLPRVEKIVACTPEQCKCGNCGADKTVIGYAVSEVLDVKPAEYFVQVTKREKCACKQCEEQGVSTAYSGEVGHRFR